MTVEKDNLPKLPEGWVWTRLGEVTLAPQYGWTTSAVREGRLHLLRTTDITSGDINWNFVPYCKEEPPDVEKYLLKDGDIVISRAGSVGYSQLIKRPKMAVFASYLIRFKPLINERYIDFFLKSPLYWQSISQKTIGIAIPNVNATKLKQILMPLPPLPEQARIVAKIEELSTKLDAGVESLKKAKTQLERYRQAVLNATVEGKLTREWREAHKGEVEPASVLLERILEERREKWEAESLHKMNTKRKTPKNENWKKKYKVPAIRSAAKLPELPKTWVWTSIEQIAYVGTGATPLRSNPKYYESGNIPWVKSSALNRPFVTEADEMITELAIKETNAKLFPPNTLLVALYGEGKTRGKVSELLIEAATNQACAAIVLEGQASHVRPYVKLYFQKNYADIRRLSFGGVQPNLSLGIIKSTAIPLPPLDEQHIIVDEVERRLSLVEDLDNSIKVNLKRAERLRQSILIQAFSGRLVPQDPSDEPAKKLLEQIREERAKRNPSEKTRKQRNAQVQMELVRYVE